MPMSVISKFDCIWNIEYLHNPSFFCLFCCWNRKNKGKTNITRQKLNCGPVGSLYTWIVRKGLYGPELNGVQHIQPKKIPLIKHSCEYVFTERKKFSFQFQKNKNWNLCSIKASVSSRKPLLLQVHEFQNFVGCPDVMVTYVKNVRVQTSWWWRSIFRKLRDCGKTEGQDCDKPKKCWEKTCCSPFCFPESLSVFWWCHSSMFLFTLAHVLCKEILESK